MHNRLRIIRKAFSFSQNEMADVLGITQSTYSKMEKGESAITAQHLVTLEEKLGVNPTFILVGKGGMKVTNTGNPADIDSANILVPAVAFAGYSTMWPQYQKHIQFVEVPGITGPARTFEVSGDSMEPILLSGDWICCKQTERITDIKPGKVYALVSEREGITVKQLAIEGEFVVCHPANVHYSATMIHMEDVKEIWEVKLRITPHFGRANYDINLAEKVGKIEQFLKENFNQYKPT